MITERQVHDETVADLSGANGGEARMETLVGLGQMMARQKADQTRVYGRKGIHVHQTPEAMLISHHPE